MAVHEGKKASIPRTFFAIAVSDVHLGYRKSDSDAFKAFVDEFLSEQSVDHLIIMGDVLDLWTRDDRRLMRETEGLLEKISSLKEQGRIGVIDYVVGNHDFTIESLKTDYPVLNAFDFKSPTSEKPAWLLLRPPKQTGSRKQTFGFLHGHQLLEGSASKVYDGTCRYLCSQGDFRGWLSRLAFDIRNWVPVVFGVAALAFFVLSRNLSALAAAIVAVASAVTLYRSPPDLESISAMSYDEQIEVLVRTMRWRDRRRLVRYLKQSPHKRSGMAPLDLENVQHAYHTAQRRLPDIIPEETHAALGKSLGAPLDDSAISALVMDAHRVLGHTHKQVNDEHYTNLGSWEKKSRHWYFTVSENGDHHLEEWVWEPASRSKRISRRVDASLQT